MGGGRQLFFCLGIFLNTLTALYFTFFSSATFNVSTGYFHHQHLVGEGLSTDTVVKIIEKRSKAIDLSEYLKPIPCSQRDVKVFSDTVSHSEITVRRD